MGDNYFDKEFVKKVLLSGLNYPGIKLAPSLLGYIEGVAGILSRQVNKKIHSHKPNLPAPNESKVLSFSNLKSAALSFDKIWVPADNDAIPKEVTFYGVSEEERSVMIHILMSEITLIARDTEYNKTIEPLRDLQLARDLVLLNKADLLPQNAQEMERFLKNPVTANFAEMRAVSNALKRQYNLDVPVLYDSEKSKNREYKSGDYLVVCSILQDIALPDEEKLTWDQVLEFRKDINAKKKYRRLTHWLDAEMVGKPLSFIEDEIGQRLEDYNSALDKHGLRKITGSLLAALDPMTLLAASGAYITGRSTGQEWIGMLTGASILLHKCAVCLKQEKLDLENVKRSHPEIHFIYEVKKKLN